MLFQRFPNPSEGRQRVEEPSHSWFTLLAWPWEGLLLRNSIWTFPPPQEQTTAEEGRSIHSSRFMEERKDCTKLVESEIPILSHKTNKGNCEQHNDFFFFFFFLCISELSRGEWISTIYFACGPHLTEFESAVLFSHKHTNEGRKKTLLPLYFSFALFFLKSLTTFNPHPVAHRKQTIEKLLLIHEVLGSTGLHLKSNYKSRKRSPLDLHE